MLGLPTCKEVSERSSFVLEGDLTLTQRLTLKMHLMMCERCRRYVSQMKLTSETVQQWMTGRPMPEELKKTLLERFEGKRSMPNNSE